MTDELRMILEGNNPGLVDVLPRDLPSGAKGRLLKSSARIHGVWSKIQTEHLNPNLEH
jgi:hypothetical protein